MNNELPKAPTEGINTIASLDQNYVAKSGQNFVADESKAVAGTNPGTSIREDSSLSRGISIKGLGSLDEIEDETPEEDPGTGEKIVICHDTVLQFAKGQVIRISKLFPIQSGSKKKGVSDINKRAIKRFFDLGAIRLATDEELNSDFVQLDAKSETPEVHVERMKRVQAQRQLQELKKQIANGGDPKELIAQFDESNPVHEIEGLDIDGDDDEDGAAEESGKKITVTK